MYKFEIYDEGLEVRLQITLDACDSLEDLSDNPEIQPAYDAFMEKLSERGWVDQNYNAIISLTGGEGIIPKTDGSKVFLYYLTPRYLN